MSANIRRALVIAVIASGLVAKAALCQPPPVPAAAASTTGTATTGQVAPAAPQPAPGPLEREELTGNWNGTRTHWKDKRGGVDSSLTQFY